MTFSPDFVEKCVHVSFENNQAWVALLRWKTGNLQRVTSQFAWTWTPSSSVIAEVVKSNSLRTSNKMGTNNAD